MASPQLSERLLTAEEFFALPDPERGGKMELIDGRVVTHMPVTGKHGVRAIDIGAELRAFARAHKLGEVGGEIGFIVRRNPDTVLAPDIAFVAASPEHPDGTPEEGFVPWPPTLAVEVISPNDLDSEVTGKVDTYLAAGVSRVWVVRPKRQTVTVYRDNRTARIVGMDGALTSDDAAFAVEGFSLAISDLFA